MTVLADTETIAAKLEDDMLTLWRAVNTQDSVRIVATAANMQQLTQELQELQELQERHTRVVNGS